MIKKQKRRDLTIEERISIIQSSTQLEGFTLSEKALERCRMVMDGSLSAEQAIDQIISEK
jgi:hypothetical protein